MQINIAVIKKAKKKLKGTQCIGKYTTIYSGVTQKRAAKGVAILVDKDGQKRVMYI
jgi:hypothetical protein